MIDVILLIAIIAVLYSSVGHGGASGYIAVFALLSYPTAFIRQDALILNIIVSSIAVFSFAKAGHFSFKLFLPLVLFSIPFAFIGGSYQLSADTYKIVLGAFLLVPALLFFVNKSKVEKTTRNMPFLTAGVIGSALGLISGLTGIGGGVFLSPILIFGRWAGQKTTAAISAAFILVNSIAGLAGSSLHSSHLDPNIFYFAIAAVLGSVMGSRLGAYKVSPPHMRILLGIVLLIASFKLIFF